MIKHVCLPILLFLAPIFVKAQQAYITTEIGTSTGMNLIDNGDEENSKSCQVKTGSVIYKFTPLEVKEYGFKNGRAYVSKELQVQGVSKSVFLERLAKGKTSLYYYCSEGNAMFYLEKPDGKLYEIPEYNDEGKSYKQLIKDLTNDCEGVNGYVQYLSYRKKSMANLLSRYENCAQRPFPHFRYGLNLGYNFTMLNIPTGFTNQTFEGFDFKYETGSSIGLFVDNPIKNSDFTYHGEIEYSKSGFSYSDYGPFGGYDFVSNIHSLKLPLLVRYTYPSNHISPFVDVGGAITYNFINKSFLYQSTISGNMVDIAIVNGPGYIGDMQFGYSCGAGFEFKLITKQFLFFEFRFNQSTGLGEVKTLGNSTINLITGINF
jgi:hypothetical protein